MPTSPSPEDLPALIGFCRPQTAREPNQHSFPGGIDDFFVPQWDMSFSPVPLHRDDLYDDHPLVKAIERRAPPVETLRLIQLRLARLVAELGYMAEHEAEFTVADARAITRQARELRRFATLVAAEHRALGRDASEVDPTLVRQVLSLLYDRVSNVARDVLPQEMADNLCTRASLALASDPGIPWR